MVKSGNLKLDVVNKLGVARSLDQKSVARVTVTAPSAVAAEGVK